MDYFVPNFGRDVHDTMATEQSLATAESMLGHKWEWNPSEEEIIQYPHPPLDSEISDSIEHMGQAESDLGHEWTVLQLNSDPICSSAGCT
jgi:hypothetical protein